MRNNLVIFIAVLAGINFPARAVDFSDKDLNTARKIYVVKCAKCHELYDPKKYNDADWNSWMEKMRKKSKLKPEQFDLLNSYSQALRKEK